MKNASIDRRTFLATTAGISTILPLESFAILKNNAPKLRFSVIGINHGHIYSMAKSVIRGGGQLVSFYALEDDLANNFAKSFPEASGLVQKKKSWKTKASA